MYHSVSTLEEFQNYLDRYPCILKLTDPVNCGPCRNLAPKFEELASKYGTRGKFLVANIGAAPIFGRHFRLTSIPQVMFFQNGNPRPDLKVTGCNPALLESNVTQFIQEAGLIEPLNSFSVDWGKLSDLVNPPEQPDESSEELEEKSDYNSDPDKNEYGEDCEIPIEKTIADLK